MLRNPVSSAGLVAVRKIGIGAAVRYYRDGHAQSGPEIESEWKRDRRERIEHNCE